MFSVQGGFRFWQPPSHFVGVNGWAPYPYCIRRAFREKVKETAGQGRVCLRVWPRLHLDIVVKQIVKKRGVQVTRYMSMEC